jgi:hypothetical protein
MMKLYDLKNNLSNLKNSYVNIISRSVIQLFVNNCVTCLKKKGEIVNSMVFNAHGQVDLTDMQSWNDGGYRFVCQKLYNRD